ncbi:c-type cytochrome [Paralcaligenes ureilyticus]|uniref:Mono/diheme cytochrome c family protein n=1 Tax=Paralcaligenes ureilyticus TaxID=627131 RepID=A0A4V2UXQ8_9BURK|nr:cytochrome c [Paralcaligenes ureilyticus]TCT04428.1 mono/diheme cytochrome c family protein [Paralcaligenes ureilyticus]
MKFMTRLQCDFAAAVMALASLSVCAAATTNTASTELIQRGQYLATAGDCIACHTATGGKPFAGGLLLSTPVGDIVSTNITPSKTNGIGHYTLEQFTNALRKGVRADGQHLYPAMPYTSYAKVTDDDIKAMYAYFMQAVEPVDASPPSTNLPFPFNIRLSMAGWNLLFLDDKPYKPVPDKGELWNRGAYLTQGLTHCSACHTPRNIMMAEDFSRNLGGGEVGTWYAPNITSDANSGIGGWSEQEIISYLQLGHADGKGQAAGPMAEAIDHSLRHLNAADLRAIAVYLKTVPALHDAADTRPVYVWGTAGDDLNSIRGVPLPKNLDQMTGPQLYDANCASCHQARGQGSPDGGLPALFHNTALGRTNTNNLVMVLLDGIERRPDAPDVLMPGFRAQLSDIQIATLGTYLTQHYGNPGANVTVEQVKTLRAGGEPSHLIWFARVGMIIAGLLLVALFLLGARKRGK